MKRFFVVLTVFLVVVALAVPAFAATDTGSVYGSYLIDLDALFPLLDVGNATPIHVTGTAVVNGVTYQIEQLQASSSGFYVIAYPSQGIQIVHAGTLRVDSLELTLDATQLDLTGSSATALADQWLFRVLRASEWLDAPEPFLDSIGSSVQSLVSWLGNGLTAITSGPLSPMLPLIGIGVAVSVVLVVWLLIKRSSWGA